MHAIIKEEPRGYLGRLGRVMIAVLFALSLVGPVGVASVGAAPVQASAFQITSFTQRDTNGDGKIDQAVIHCRCFSDNDRIVVNDPAGDMKPADTVDQGTDMRNDLWLFDVGNHGTFRLAVQFNDVNNQLSADVYEDENADGTVATGVVSGHPAVTEPGFPVVHVVSLDGYWQRDGRIAPDLNITVDGSLLATFGAEKYTQYMSNDGKPDVVIRVRGPHDGDPRSYDWRNVETPIPASSAIYRSTLMVREHGQEPAFSPIFPWYLLGATYGSVNQYKGVSKPTVPLTGSEGRPYGIVKPYGESFPPIQVDWNSGKVRFIGEIVASRASSENWFTYSNYAIKPGKLNEPDFESPFAFYNLAQDGSDRPDLQVRVERAIPGDRFVDPNWKGRPYQQIRYSWEQRSGQLWSFKLGLLGQKPINQTVTFPDFSLTTLPYDQLPSWVTSNTWDVATFVAVEGESYHSTEGIYEWDPAGALRDGYYSGANAKPPSSFDSITSGLRGEYALHLDAQPWLYLSPVDGRLHLAGATSGVYQQDKTTRVVYRNLAGGQYIDAWLGYDHDQLVRQLYQVPNGLLFAANDTVSLLDATVPQESFRTLPPTSHAEWAAVGERLSTIRPIKAADLQTMYSQFTGKQATITNATLSDLRFTESGYRFILDLRPGFDLGGLTMNGISAPGSYEVSYDSSTHQYSAQPAKAAHVIVTAANVPARAHVRQPVPAEFRIVNQGSADFGQLPAIITARTNNGAPIVVGQKTVDLLSESPVEVAASWQPPHTGNWDVTTTVYLPDGSSVKQSETVVVGKAHEPPWQEVVRGAWPHTSAPLYLSLLLGLVAIPLASGLLLIRRDR